jgi:hypothetical protein
MQMPPTSAINTLNLVVQQKAGADAVTVSITKTEILNLDGLSRLGSYLAIWFSYLTFMSSHAPRGIDWLSWHLRRIYNAVQYVEVNGYLSQFGFSIWSSCQDCGFSISEWVGKIYLSVSVFKLFPYIVLNHYWGFDALQKYGPQIDRLAIFIGAVAAAELIIICVHKYSLTPDYFVGVVAFTFFISAPWTYRMLLSSWFEIYFLAFFLLGMLCFTRGYKKLGLLMLFLAGFFHYQWALGLVALYSLLYIGSEYFKSDSFVKQYLPSYGRTLRGLFVIVLALMVSAMGEGGMRWLAMQNMEITLGSSLLFRIGISGDDINNGGLLGALQFLGGNRVTICLADYGSGAFTENLTDSITRYNCILSIGSMLLLSLSAIVGLVILVKKSVPAKWIVFPLAFALLLFITILQQSLSVHLMGYSYIFSFLFSTGIVSLMVFLSQYIGSVTLRVAMSIPCVLGIVFLSIRVSMLTGVNG